MYFHFSFFRIFYLALFLSLLIPSNTEAAISIWGFDDNPVVEKESEEDVSDEALSTLIEEVEERDPFFEEEPEEIEPTLNTLSDTGQEEEVKNLDIEYDVPIVINEHVAKYIKLFQTRLRPDFELWLSRSGRYLQRARKTLRENQLPEDLVYVAMIESGFNAKAYSRSRASGIWQFIKGTGKRYGLRIDRWIDERRDPIKSTEAAARYLTELYEMFESWPLALAAYNAGEGRVYKTIVRVRTRDFWKLRKSRHLRAETRNYVPKFMAATIIAKNPEHYQFFVDYEDSWQYDEVEIEKATYLSAIARYAGISVKELKKYNPELKQDVTPPRFPGYRIKLPPGKREVFLAAYSPDQEEEIFVGRTFRHRVRRGETISTIAQQYGVSTTLLLETNRLAHNSIIRVGQHIMINESPVRAGNQHIIRRGESISTIASKYNVSIRRLLEANQLHKRSVIRAGHALIIPEARSRRRKRSAQTRALGDQKKHRIMTGESISTIAQKYAVRMRDLLKVNQLTKTSVIRAGRTLIIP